MVDRPAQSGPTFDEFRDKFAPKLDSSTQINGRKWLYVIVNGLETLFTALYGPLEVPKMSVAPQNGAYECLAEV